MNMAAMIPVVNMIVIVFLVLFIIGGWRKGFLWKLLSILSFFVTGILSWWLSSPLSNIFHLYPKNYVPLVNTIVEPYIYDFLNRTMMFIILFILISICVMLLKPIFKFIHHIPVISGINRIAGSLLGAIQGLLILVIVSLFLRTPGWQTGTILMEQSLFKHSDVVLNAALFYAKEPLQAIESIQDSINNAESLTEDEIDTIRDWLSNLPIEKENVDAFIGTLKSES